MQTMQMNLRAPVAQMRSGTKMLASPLPCMARLQKSNFFSGSTQTFVNVSGRKMQARVQKLKVEAAKKSVGDLSKGDLEGKVVLVSHFICLKASCRMYLKRSVEIQSSIIGVRQSSSLSLSGRNCKVL